MSLADAHRRMAAAPRSQPSRMMRAASRFVTTAARGAGAPSRTEQTNVPGKVASNVPAHA
ncbi:MAG: hypothetical protein JOZ26_04505 [Hyphomicrobiales bacterium]|nr:hypothetical protein [Hyphomicrobiales bacterium]